MLTKAPNEGALWGWGRAGGAVPSLTRAHQGKERQHGEGLQPRTWLCALRLLKKGKFVKYRISLELFIQLCSLSTGSSVCSQRRRPSAFALPSVGTGQTPPAAGSGAGNELLAGENLVYFSIPAPDVCLVGQS